jgi:hypothetical protein
MVAAARTKSGSGSGLVCASSGSNDSSDVAA